MHNQNSFTRNPKPKGHSLTSTQFPLDSKISRSTSKKMYVPITPLHENQPQHLNKTEFPNLGNSHLHVPTNIGSASMTISELKKSNAELKEKQQIYIDKLMKLEEGLEKQHLEYLQLQDHYNQLFNSYKQKEEQISELEMLFRQTNRKKEAKQAFDTPHMSAHPKITAKFDENRMNLLEQELIRKQLQIQKMSKRIESLTSEISGLNEKVSKLMVENNYYKNKEKMNDSRASLHSKVFQEMEEWQRVADAEKEEKIHIQYENQFLNKRNQDLEKRIEELEDLVKNRQSEIAKLRQNNIMLHRQNSETKLLSRSASRSPKKTHTANNTIEESKLSAGNKSLNSTIPNSSNTHTKLIDQLYQENKTLKQEIVQIKQRKQEKSLRNSQNTSMSMPAAQTFSQHYSTVKEEQFFSFSREQNQHNAPVENKLTREQRSEIYRRQIMEATSKINEQSTKENETTYNNGQLSKRSEVDSLDDNPSRVSYQNFSVDFNSSKKQSSSPPRFSKPYASSKKQKSPQSNSHLDELQDLPPSLQIQTLIKQNKEKMSQSQSRVSETQ